MSSSSSLQKPLRKFSEYDDYNNFYNELRNYLSNIDKNYINVMDYVEKQNESIEKVTLMKDMGNVEENYMDQMSSVYISYYKDEQENKYNILRGTTRTTSTALNYGVDYIT